MADGIAISLENVGVRYLIQKERPTTVQEYFINILRRKKNKKAREAFWAVREITFTVEKGQALGIIGHNGAGKSTILRVISGVIQPTEGRVEVNGKISPIIDISAGFVPDLTGLENIYLSASVLGFSRKEIQKKLPEIIEFSGLHEFINSPIRSYSTGMIARLGFSVAISVEPDILIIDEVLAVGDQQFKRKCLEKIKTFKEKGTTILFVSHNIGEVARLCDRILWLKHGRIYRLGQADIIARQYLDEVKRPAKT